MSAGHLDSERGFEYYDRAMSMHSPDPTDPSVTQRIITIMLAEEY